MLATLFILSLAQEPKIDFEAVATRVDKVLSEISKQAGATLSTSPATKDEFLVLRLKGVPLKEAMDKIALATAAEWQAEAGGYRLIRSAKLLREQDQAHVKDVTDRVVEAQDKLREQLSKDGDFNAAQAKAAAERMDALIQEARANRGDSRNWQAQDQLAKSLPSGRLARQLAASLDPAALAKMGMTSTRVFSTDPNPMQLPLGRQAWESIRGYVQARTLFQDKVPQAEEDYVSGLPWGVHTLRQSQKLRDQVPAKLLLQVRRFEYSGGLNVQMWIANRAGQVLDSASTTVQTAPLEGRPPAPPGDDPTGSAPIELSPGAKALNDWAKRMMAQGDRAPTEPMPEVLRGACLHPEDHCLAEFLYSDVLLGLARARGLNLVARADDLTGVYSVMVFGGSSPTANQVLDRLKMIPANTLADETPGWIVMRPLDPYLDRARKVDRAALGKLVRTAAAKGAISVDECAEFAASCPEEFDRTVVMIPLMVTAPLAGRDFEQRSFQVLRFHGSLGPAQKQVLAAKRPLPFAQLSPVQQRIFHRLIFDEPNNMSRSVRSEPPNPDDEAFRGETLRWQPTERFPNGVPPAASVWGDFSSGSKVSVSGTFGPYRTSGDLDLASIASYLWQKENPPRDPQGEQTVYTEFSAIEQMLYRYTFAPDTTMSFASELKDVRSRSAVVSTPDKLPPAIWARILTELQAIRTRSKPPS